MKLIWTVARRELKALLDYPTGYIILVVFLGINDFLFFRTAYLIELATLRPMFDLLPWLFLFFIPAIAMRSLAEDARTGTVEVVLAQPISEMQYLLGKYFGQLLFIWLGLVLSLGIPIGFSFGADLNVGVIFAQYMGAALLAAGMTAVGVFASSLTKNQVTAFIVGVAIMFGLILVGLDPLLLGLPPAIGAMAASLGVLSHFTNIGRGVIDLRDVVYFVTLAGVFISLSYRSVLADKLAPRRASRKRLDFGVMMLVSIMVVINLFGREIGGRLDLTPGGAYTLSNATRELVAELDDIVTIRLFASDDLPPEVALLRRDIDDLLSDYRSAGSGKVRVIELNPDEDEDAKSEAEANGIPAIQFNVIGDGELQVKSGYLGLAVQFADGSETIPFIRQTSDLEYRLSSFIRGLVRTSAPVIGFATTELRTAPATYERFRRVLSETYDVRTYSVGADSVVPEEFKALVIIGNPDSLPDRSLDAIGSYLEGGGSAFVMAPGMELNLGQPIAVSKTPKVNRFLSPYGVSVNTDMVYDLASNERISVPSGMARVLMSYPFWVRGISTKAVTLNAELDAVMLPWTSSVDVSTAAPGTVTPLFITSQAASVENDAALIQPGREFQQDSLGIQLLAVQIDPTSVEGSGLKGRLVVVGSSAFMGDDYAGSSPINISFGLNAVDWLAQDEALIGIRSKNRRPPQLAFDSEVMKDFVRYGNLAGVPTLLVLLAVVRMVRRRNRSRTKLVTVAQAEVT